MLSILLWPIRSLPRPPKLLKLIGRLVLLGQLGQ